MRVVTIFYFSLSISCPRKFSEIFHDFSIFFMTNVNPSIKRLQSEYRHLIKNPEPDFVASPLDGDLYCWHFTIKGPKDSPFEGGIYHGQINFPIRYPYEPPDIKFFTPNGRFQTNTEICLNITSFHKETWKPAWDIRTALLSIIAFMPTDPENAVGSMNRSDQTKRELAIKSRSWKCKRCNLTIEPDDIPEEKGNKEENKKEEKEDENKEGNKEENKKEKKEENKEKNKGENKEVTDVKNDEEVHENDDPKKIGKSHMEFKGLGKSIENDPPENVSVAKDKKDISSEDCTNHEDDESTETFQKFSQNFENGKTHSKSGDKKSEYSLVNVENAEMISSDFQNNDKNDGDGKNDIQNTNEKTLFQDDLNIGINENRLQDKIPLSKIENDKLYFESDHRKIEIDDNQDIHPIKNNGLLKINIQGNESPVQTLDLPTTQENLDNINNMNSAKFTRLQSEIDGNDVASEKATVNDDIAPHMDVNHDWKHINTSVNIPTITELSDARNEPEEVMHHAHESDSNQNNDINNEEANAYHRTPIVTVVDESPDIEAQLLFQHRVGENYNIGGLVEVNDIPFSIEFTQNKDKNTHVVSYQSLVLSLEINNYITFPLLDIPIIVSILLILYCIVYY
ncbi:hypothetical protein TRFO_14035 [Tritrichomonas foetus]|uniref:UBC core domain-containing protein n=1 Tax=Tritrichomonas foetus TaxID=1144522 RepID=A0A1J4KW29_9EUKA|nr:hypothetical protein TRFO_14035 [Tritrichomonas foetus]|eukprot:OHT15443.1 hypothetical protein TRFO_14035 [Tritrichomonas foetus]